MAIAADAGLGQRIDGEMSAGGLHALLGLARTFDAVGRAVGDDIDHRHLGDALDLVVGDSSKAVAEFSSARTPLTKSGRAIAVL